MTYLKFLLLGDGNCFYYACLHQLSLLGKVNDAMQNSYTFRKRIVAEAEAVGETLMVLPPGVDDGEEVPLFHTLIRFPSLTRDGRPFDRSKLEDLKEEEELKKEVWSHFLEEQRQQYAYTPYELLAVVSALFHVHIDLWMWHTIDGRGAVRSEAFLHKDSHAPTLRIGFVYNHFYSLADKTCPPMSNEAKLQKIICQLRREEKRMKPRRLLSEDEARKADLKRATLAAKNRSEFKKTTVEGKRQRKPTKAFGSPQEISEAKKRAMSERGGEKKKQKVNDEDD